MKLISNESQGASLMISQHWVRKWLVDPGLCRHMGFLSPNELTYPLCTAIHSTESSQEITFLIFCMGYYFAMCLEL